MVSKSLKFRKTTLIIAIILLIVATSLLVLHFLDSARPEGYVDGQGIIDNITTTWTYDFENPTSESHYFVKYSYEGVEYISELQNYAGSFKVGDEIHILINPNDPNMIQTLGTAEGNRNSLIFCFIVYGTSFVFGAIYSVLLIRDKKKNV